MGQISIIIRRHPDVTEMHVQTKLANYLLLISCYTMLSFYFSSVVVQCMMLSAKFVGSLF